ncbi:Hpt domain-containing protein, partial [Comamonas sp.]|uniref:Hpt domain-containing protein n=1 Tax=Comamonas sp. TaxID=34028 RepID=UPI0028A292CF
MSPTEVTAPTGHVSHGEQDLGPLAWVLEELRKSLDGAVKATRRFVREAQEASHSDLAALDSSPLRTAKQQLHQSSGALEMVGMPQPALLLRAMETALQHYVQHPVDCTEAVVQTLETASFALLEFLDAILAGKQISSVALFPQYRDVQALYGNEGKVHPADLWPIERRLRDPQLPQPVAPLGYSPEQRKVLDAAVLQIVKGQDLASASARMRDVCMGFAQAQAEPSMRIFWKVAAAYFDAMAYGLLKADIYTKRVASRVLMVSAALAKGDPVAPERLLQDMLFFCAQAASMAEDVQAAPVWRAVYAAFGLQRHHAVNYEQPRFGRFDPALLAQARKRIASATELWSALAGGDVQKIKPAVDQFSLVADSLSKLHPDSRNLVNALMQVMQTVASRGQPPSAEVAMEVATSVLYLQAAFASLDLADEAMAAHGATLAHRLASVLAGEAAQPLETWMEQLYRQVSDQQTMGSVVGELRGTLAEAEKLLDQYFRNPSDRSMLGAVGAHLAQMRGVLSVLGLDQASLAMVRMRQNVERLQQNAVPEDEQSSLFEKMGNSLGALGFLIDMLSYQRNMARKLYEFDEEAGELRLLMGRVRVRASDGAANKPVEDVVQARVEQIVQPVILPQSPAPAALVSPVSIDAAGELQPSEHQLEAREIPAEPASSTTVLAAVPQEVLLQVSPEDTDSELLHIFLEEAREVVANGRAALQALAQDPASLSEQTVLRRAFHTLKGSSRMVGLDEFGQAGWAMEQMLNAWLAEQKAMPAAMQTLSLQALNGFEAWVNAIEAGVAPQWQSAPFRASADAMRLDARFIALDMQAVQGGAVATAMAEPVAVLDVVQQSAAEALTLELPSAGSMDREVVAAQPEQPEQPTPADEAQAVVLDVVPAVDEAGLLLDLDGVANTVQDAAGLPLEAAAPDVPQAEEISFDEFDALLQTAGDGISAPILPPAEREPEAALPAYPELVQMMQSQEAANQELAAAEPVASAQAVQEMASSTKQVGDLSIPLPLFNVYLGEAEAWSYRLLDALTAWQENLDEAQPDMVEAWAHSLAGSSATVGFTALSDLARKLEHALQHVASQPQGVQAQVACFVRAAEEIRRVLHQFAAGFLPAVSEYVLDTLQGILDAEVDASVVMPATSAQPEAGAQVVAQPHIQHVEPALDEVAAVDAAIARALQLDDASGDDIDALDVIDPDLFPIFEEEAIELLPTLGAAMREWGAHPTRLEARSTLLRALHTLKGSARLAGAMRMGEMAHRLESALEALDVDTVTTEQIEPLFVRLDAIEADFNVLRAVGVQADSEPIRVEPAAMGGAAPAVADSESPVTLGQTGSSVPSLA